MDAALRRTVRERAGHRCEYCRLRRSEAPFLTFHVEHVTAKQHVDDDSLENLALACPFCNRFKGPNLTTVDPTSRQIVRLFNPREDEWDDHFDFDGAFIVGLSPVGTATVRLLQMNSRRRVEMRAELLEDDEG